NNYIGGNTGDGSGNLIGANGTGVVIDGTNATNNVVVGNAIGTSFNGALDLGNGQDGVMVNGDQTIVGQALAGSGTVIAPNRAGHAVTSKENSLRGNSIFASRVGLGIDLLSAGVNPVAPNDSLDGDDGPNYLQNFPVLTAVSVVGTQVRLQGRYSSEINS